MNGRTCGDHTKYSIIKIDQNTEKIFWKLEKTCCHSLVGQRPLANDGVTNSPGIIIIIIIIIMYFNVLFIITRVYLHKSLTLSLSLYIYI